MFLKIINLKHDGVPMLDYKGLDIDLFIAGSQAYDNECTTCVVKTMQEVIPGHEDTQIIDVADYLSTKAAFETNRPKSEVQLLQEQVNDLTLAMAAIMGGAM